MTFDEAFERLLGHEGGYVNDPRDPGGETKFGISKRSYPAEDIKNMSVGRAKVIYRRDFWGPAGIDALPDAVKFDVFDMAVNSGVSAAIKCVQRAVGAVPDGQFGPMTLQSVNSMPAPRLLARFNGARLLLMTSLPTWSTFGEGWTRRVAQNLLNA